MEGKVAVVTGGGAGLGAALAGRCAALGCDVVIADIDGAAAQQICGDLERSGFRAVACTTDVSDPEAMQSLAEFCNSTFGACNYLFNNAGIAFFKPIMECTFGDWTNILSVNLLGVVNGISAFAPGMVRSSGQGHIVNIASMAGLLPLPGFGAYVATKYAVLGLSEVLAEELSSLGVKVSVVCPGWINTRIQQQDPDAAAPVFPSALERAISAESAAEIILDGVRRGEFLVVTHPEWGVAVKSRMDSLLRAFG